MKIIREDRKTNYSKAKKILEKDGKKYTDEQVKIICDYLRQMAVLQIQIEDNCKVKSTGKEGIE